MRNLLAFLLGFTLMLGVNGCNNTRQSIPQVIGPNLGQWLCYGCSGMSLAGNGGFTFPNSSGGVGYIYTGVSGTPGTITLTYTVSGSGTVLPSPASGSGPALIRLFMWRRGDDLACTPTTEWFRWWSAPGPLTPGQHTISAVVRWDQWTDCYGKQDSNQFTGAVSNLLGIGFTFGAEFAGHGVYSTGSNTFTINSFTVQ